MPCPTCTHTMQNLGLAQNGKRTFWCPRCGTIKTESGQHEEHEKPMLVTRVRDAKIEPLCTGNIMVSLYDWKSIDEAAGTMKN